MGSGEGVLWVLILAFSATQCVLECEERERKDMINNFINCTGEQKNIYNHEMMQDNVDIDKVTCNLVKKLVETCGELWGLCHSREEVRRMKDMQVKDMILKNSDSGVDIEKCLAIFQHRQDYEFL